LWVVGDALDPWLDDYPGPWARRLPGRLPLRLEARAVLINDAPELGVVEL